MEVSERLSASESVVPQNLVLPRVKRQLPDFELRRTSGAYQKASQAVAVGTGSGCFTCCTAYL